MENKIEQMIKGVIALKNIMDALNRGQIAGPENFTTLIEEQDGVLHTFEFKWNPRAKSKLPRSFADNYSPVQYEVVTPENFWKFVRF